jgi:hypothetical protein
MSAKLPTPARGAVRRVDQPDQQRRVNQRVDEDASRRAEPEQQRRPDQRTHEKAEVPAGRIQTHRARQLTRLDDLMNQDLRGRHPNYAGKAMNDEQQRRRPEGDRVGREQNSPGDGDADEQ